MDTKYNIVVDGKKIILSKYIQDILEKKPNIWFDYLWEDLKNLYKSKNYRYGKITDKELETIFNQIDETLNLDKNGNFSIDGVPYILEFYKVKTIVVV